VTRKTQPTKAPAALLATLLLLLAAACSDSTSEAQEGVQDPGATAGGEDSGPARGEDPGGSRDPGAASSGDRGPAGGEDEGGGPASDPGPAEDPGPATADATEVADVVEQKDEGEQDVAEPADTTGAGDDVASDPGPSTPPEGSAWPMFGGGTRSSGRSAATFRTGYELLWSVDVPDFGYGGAALGPDGRVVGASHGPERIYAVSADGSELWTTDLPSDVWSVDVTPAVDAEGQVYAVAQSGHYLRLGAGGEVEVSKIIMVGDGLGATFFRGSPTLDGEGNIYAPTDPGLGGGTATLFKIDPQGEVLWKRAYGPSSSGDGAPAIDEDGSVVVATNGGDVTSNGLLMRLDPADGTLKDSHQEIGYFRGSPALGEDGSIYLASRGGVLAFGADLEPLWKTPEAVGRGTPAVGADRVYVLTDASKLVAIDRSDGMPLWEHQLTAGSDLNRAQPAVDACDRVAAATSGGELALLSPAGDVLFEATFEGQALSGPAIGHGGEIYVRAYKLFAYGGGAPGTCGEN